MAALLARSPLLRIFVAATLKSRNKPMLVSVLLLNLALFAVLIATNALIFPDTVELMRQWRSVVPAGLALLAVGVINEQLSPNTKARLVFWRWHGPLAGRAAFSKLGPADSRVNMAVIKAKLGKLPKKPADQNRAWYGLYRTVKDDPAVVDIHRSFLLYRDCASMVALLIIPLTAVALWKIEPRSTAWAFGAILFGEYLLFKRAAAGAGCRFVTTVLAIKSAEA